MKRAALTIVCLLPLALTDCGRVPKATTTRDSGQSGLMDESFAAKNACNPDNADRPFIIEWDATDMSSFESYAASDVVVVKYEGCNLRLLDECRNDSIRGSQGAYKPVEWTTGSLEKLNIASQGELYAKLPLGAASLGGRVAGGEKFSMEYYVAGTRNATRSAVYRDDIATNPGCEGATHFVYGYNLGAFALGSVKDFTAEAGGSAYGFGVGGKTSSNHSAEKKGGDLGACKSEAATEIAGCKAPIRLTLRKIRDGKDPERAAMATADTPESLNAAGQIHKKLEMSEVAMAHYESAIAKQNARDGDGCLAELDQHDKLNPKKQSTDPKSPLATTRGICLMIAGKCDIGKGIVRKAMEQQGSDSRMTPKQMDATLSGYAQQFCGGKLAPRDELLKAMTALRMASSASADPKPTSQTCTEHYTTVKKLQPVVKPQDDRDRDITSIDLPGVHHAAMKCYMQAGDCKQTHKLYLEFTWDKEMRDKMKGVDEQSLQRIIDKGFGDLFEGCKGKAP
jgi:hypothetical protein